MSRRPRATTDLADAAAVHMAREQIVQALGPLAASPLDEQATTQMRRALERAQSPAVRRALRRLSRPGEPRPPLAAVPMTTDARGTRRDQASPPRPIDLGIAYTPGGAA